MSSLSTEHYGLLSIGVTILSILLATTFTTVELELLQLCTPITVHIDNSELVKQGNKLAAVYIMLKSQSVPEFDLWELSNAILSSVPLWFKCEWVKTHQDDDTVLADLDMAAYLNVTADQNIGHQRQNLLQQWCCHRTRPSLQRRNATCIGVLSTVETWKHMGIISCAPACLPRWPGTLALSHFVNNQHIAF